MLAKILQPGRVVWRARIRLLGLVVIFLPVLAAGLAWFVWPQPGTFAGTRVILGVFSAILAVIGLLAGAGLPWRARWPIALFLAALLPATQFALVWLGWRHFALTFGLICLPLLANGVIRRRKLRAH